jgi:PAS domain S-box-containing protein
VFQIGRAATGHRRRAIQWPMAEKPSSQLLASDPRISQKDGVWIIDAESKTVFANESMAQILGATTVDLTGQDSFLHIFPEDLPAAQPLSMSKRAGSSAPFHFKLRRMDGIPVWVDVQGTPMHNAAGDFLGVVGTFTVSDVEAW